MENQYVYRVNASSTAVSQLHRKSNLRLLSAPRLNFKEKPVVGRRNIFS